MFKKPKNYLSYISKNILLLTGSFLLILCTILYSSYFGFAKNTYLQTLKSNSSQAADIINNSIEQTNNLTYFISKEKAIRDFVNSDDDDTLQKIAAMNYLKTGLLFQGKVAVLIPATDCVITSSETMSLSYYVSSHNIVPEDLYGCIGVLSSGDAKSPVLFFSAHDNPYFYVIHHIERFDKPLFVIYEFNLTALLPKTNIECSFCIIQDEKLLTSIGSVPLANTMEAINKISKKYEMLPQTASTISYMKNAQCLYVAPKLEYAGHTNKLLLVALLTLLLFIVLSYIVTRVISRKLYRPINKLVNTVKNEYDSTSSNDLEFILRKISSLNDKNHALFDALSSHTKQLSDIFLSNLIKGSVPYEEIESTITKYSFDALKFPVAAFVAKIVNFETFDDVLDVSGMQILQSDIIDKFNKCFSDFEFKIINIESNKFAGVISVENVLSQKHRLILCTSEIESSLNARLRVCVGTPVYTWNDLAFSYNKASNIFDNFYFSYSSSSVILSDEVTSNNPHLYYPSNLEDSLVQAILYDKKDDISKIVTEIVETNYKAGMLDTTLHSQLVMMLVSSLSKVFLTINKNPETILTEEKDIYSTLIMHKEPENLKTEFLRITYIISDYTASIKDSTEQKIAQSMLSYIYENYAQYNISLSSLSAHINMSHSHVSRLFKQLIGENFKDYLAKYRISIAKKILEKNPSTKTKDIAKQVGYYNSETFTKAFKRYEGCSPSEYISNTFN